jgi:hypothetical protein
VASRPKKRFAMAFDDILAPDPKSEEEFWAIIEETLVQIEGALTAYPAETREEALAGTLREGKFKDASLSFIRHRGVREDLDSRDYFLELGRKFLPKVEQQIKARKLTPKFAKDWGKGRARLSRREVATWRLAWQIRGRAMSLLPMWMGTGGALAPAVVESLRADSMPAARRALVSLNEKIVDAEKRLATLQTSKFRLESELAKASEAAAELDIELARDAKGLFERLCQGS